MANLAFGEIKATIRPKWLGRLAIIEALTAIETLGAEGTLQVVSLEYKTSNDVFIQVVACDSWGTDLVDCTTKLFEALTALPSCEDVVIKYNAFVDTHSMRSDAHRKRIREE
jgi:hypothetical protein